MQTLQEEFIAANPTQAFALAANPQLVAELVLGARPDLAQSLSNFETMVRMRVPPTTLFLPSRAFLLLFDD